MYGLLMMVCLLGAEPAKSPASEVDDPASQLLVDRNFPWYDAEKKTFRPLDPPATPAPEERSKFPEFNSGGGLSVASFLLYGVLAIVLAWLAYLLYLSFETSVPQTTEQPVIPKLESAKLEALPEGVRHITDFLAEAQRLANESDFNGAMVFYFSWQLVTLHQARALELEVGKTNRQYLWEVRQSRNELSKLFYQSTRLFEEAFFGRKPVSSDEFFGLWAARNEFQVRPAVIGGGR